MNYEDLNLIIRKNFPPYTHKYKSGNIITITKKYLNHFVEVIQELDDKCFKVIKKNAIINNLKYQNAQIIKALDLFLSGEVIEYYTLIYDTYFNGKNEIKNVYFKTIPKHSPFFRLRENSLPNKNFKYNEMFHIPFEEVRRTGNQRFSLSGYPSLYLGNSTYICWEELSRPSIEKSNFSVLRNEREIRMFDITPPFVVGKEEDILRFPLGISSAIKFTDSQFPFKSEYLIPQAIFYSLLRFNKIDVLEHSHIYKLDGIMYKSPLVGEELLFSDDNQMYNYVFPVSRIEESGFCPELKKLFTVSESKTFNDIWLKYPQLVFDPSPDELKDEYEFSIFHIIEKFLKGKTVKKHNLD